MKRAAGIMFVAPGDRVLLMRRRARAEQDADFPGAWAFPGGGIEGEESAEEAARREVREECGLDYQGPLTLWTRRQGNGADFSTFIATLPEFTPTLNDEHDAYVWTPRSFAQTSNGLHPGIRVALARFDMDELGVAEAMRDGELTSPQHYGKNLMLVAMRITGTGLSYRSASEEFVWRDPSIYMNDEFLRRCAGLAVIFHHPGNDLVNTATYRERIVGAIFVAYLKPEVEEVWGIAKILDLRAGALLESEVMSTSPAVLVVGPKMKTSDGEVIMFENKPLLLDHLAVLIHVPGVWDKGQGPQGVASVDATAPADPSSVNPMEIVAAHITRKKIESIVAPRAK